MQVGRLEAVTHAGGGHVFGPSSRVIGFAIAGKVALGRETVIALGHARLVEEGRRPRPILTGDDGDRRQTGEDEGGNPHDVLKSGRWLVDIRI